MNASGSQARDGRERPRRRDGRERQWFFDPVPRFIYAPYKGIESSGKLILGHATVLRPP